ncbi:MAG TPA: PQQ-binding-like beta-propeller repeat protein [Verrucomicrobiales bacterium]|nr:PQQ-binding-like beta-propeller repeat protein [Verrucomicrobiales bacterium]
MSRPLLILSVTLAILAPVSGTADWLQFRGPLGNGTATGSDHLPTALDAARHVAWSAALPGRGLSSPVVAGERIFITAASGAEQQILHVFCFSAVDGTALWERRFRATGRTMCHEKTNVAAPTPACDGERLFALFSSNDLFCLDFQGNLLWLRGLTYDYANASNSLGLASSLLVAGDTLIVQIENDSESFAAGLKVSNGRNRWKIDRPKAANWTSPLLLRNTPAGDLVALQSTKGITAVLPESGAILWEYTDGASPIPSSAVAGELLIVPSHGLTALKPPTAGGAPAVVWQTGQLQPATASPVVLGDKVYILNGAGVLTTGRLSDGERLWRLRLEGPFAGSPVAASNHLYVFGERGIGQCVDLRGDEGVVVGTIDLGESIQCTPAISRDALYVRSDGHLWKIAADSEP